MYRLDGGSFFTSSHGRVLFLKSIAVGAMVFLGVARRQFIKERVARAERLSGRRPTGCAGLSGPKP